MDNILKAIRALLNKVMDNKLDFLLIDVKKLTIDTTEKLENVSTHILIDHKNVFIHYFSLHRLSTFYLKNLYPIHVTLQPMQRFVNFSRKITLELGRASHRRKNPRKRTWLRIA